MVQNVSSSKNDSFFVVKENNKSALERIEQFKNSPISMKARNIGFAGLVLTGLFFASMFMLQILSGVVALVASIVLLGGTFLGIRFLKNMDPLIQQKTKNMLIKKMVDEAKKNAVEQLNNHVLLNAQQLVNAVAARDKMGALVENLKSKIDFNKTDDSSNAKKIEIFNRVKNAYESVEQSVNNAKLKHKEFEKKVSEYKELNAFTEIANEAMSLFESGFDSKLNEMLSLESFESIQMEFNTAIVSIENRSKDMEIDNE